jgi:hypothetical protein
MELDIEGNTFDAELTGDVSEIILPSYMVMLSADEIEHALSNASPGRPVVIAAGRETPSSDILFLTSDVVFWTYDAKLNHIPEGLAFPRFDGLRVIIDELEYRSISVEDMLKQSTRFCANVAL